MLNFIIPHIENNFAAWEKFEFFNRIDRRLPLAEYLSASILGIQISIVNAILCETLQES